ncbi:hypothetical protein OUZ56_019441 [Daphnia magna]|uniref:Secreted protein n=1 Tax=Daphnia magna TaxID=35525 RepID=A0ABQ9ZBK6_9CRUS|nr:hypothetical protein OUZ56_019441 [Daphnia magna]
MYCIPSPPLHSLRNGYASLLLLLIFKLGSLITPACRRRARVTAAAREKNLLAFRSEPAEISTGGGGNI